MPWSVEHVVQIASRTATGDSVLGTGTLVASGRILTARHVACDAKGTPEPGLVVRGARGATFVPAKVAWQGENDLDVAVLTAALDAPPGHPLTLLSERDIRGGERWDASGYPEVREGAPSTALEKVGGPTCPWTSPERTLLLDAPTHPEVWGGLSGAAVVIGDHVVSVVRSERNGWHGQRLSATPVALFLHGVDFRRAIGLDKADEQVNERVARVVDAVTKLLKGQGGVASSLARKLALEVEPDAVAGAVARALVNDRSAGEVAKWLNHIDEELAEDDAKRGPRTAVRDLLFQILPFALDWRKLLVREWSAAPGGPSFVELPVSTRTVAEIILAGIDDRWCNFASLDKKKGIPLGAALVEVPAGKVSALIDPDGTKLGELLVQQLTAQLGVDKSLGTYAARCNAIRGKLTYYSAKEARPGKSVVYYVVFGAADLAVREQVTRVVGAELPLLRFVALGSGSEEPETVLSSHIVDILRRKVPS